MARTRANALCLWDNFYSLMVRDRRGNVAELVPHDASDVLAEKVSEPARTHATALRASSSPFWTTMCFHVPALGYDGVTGLSPIALHRVTLGLAASADEFGANFLRNQARPSGLLEHPGKLFKDAQQLLRDQWHALYAGAANAVGVAILEKG